MAWVLVLDTPASDPARRVGGLALSLRLALDAQAGGATAIVVPPGSEAARAPLVDARLKIPVVAAPPEGARRVSVPASFVVHRMLFKRLAEANDASSERDLAREPFPLQEPWGFEPVDVRDDASARAAESALFRSLRKVQDGWTSRYLNRYISLFFSRLLVRTPLRPNQISLGILAFGIAGAIVAAQGTEFGLFLGAFLLQCQSVFDGCDGEISRITHRGSRMGEWLDTIGDDLSNYGYFAGAALGLHQLTGSSLYLLAGGIVVFCGVASSAIEYRYLIKIGSGDLLKYPLSQAQSTGLLAIIGPLFKRDTFVFLTLLAAALGLSGPMLLVFSLGAIGIFISVLATEWRLYREAHS